MTDIASIVHSLGGMAQKRQLVARGARDLDLTRAIKSGEVIRARQGWYTTLPPEDPAVRAVRVGGRLTGISALAAMGAWVLSTPELHVSVPANAARLRSQWDRRARLNVASTRGVRLHWEQPDVAARGTSVSVGLVDALYRAVLDEDLETAVAVIDWALRTGQLDEIDFERLIAALPANRRHIREWVDWLCDSLPESLSRTRLRLAGHHVVSQVAVGDLESIDLVVDDIVALEIDGDEHHRERFEKDRNKDMTITMARLHVLRPSARMVFRNWGRVAAAIEVALSMHAPPGTSPIPSEIQEFRTSATARPSVSEGAFAAAALGS
jgi:very-short-patch-repair endonuclease